MLFRPVANASKGFFQITCSITKVVKLMLGFTLKLEVLELTSIGALLYLTTVAATKDQKRPVFNDMLVKAFLSLASG